MSLLRFLSRSLLASSFIVSGVHAVRHPESRVSQAEPFTERIVPLAKKYAPAEVAGSIPTDTATLVRIGGAAQVAGGLMLATGKGRRLGASILALSLLPRTYDSSPLGGGDRKDDFLMNLSLLGGVVLASRDTEGKPDLAWRAQAGGEKLADHGRKARKSLEKEAKKASKAAKKQAKAAKKAMSL